MPGRCAVDLSEIGDNADAVVVFTRALYGMDERSATQSQVGRSVAATAEGGLTAPCAHASGVLRGTCPTCPASRASGASGSASATSGGASGSASGASASAERLKRDCQTAEIAWAKKVMKTEAEKIVEAKATTANNPDTITSVNNLARCLAAQGQVR